MKKRLAILAIWLSGSACYAQSVQQTGTITPNHLAIWATNGVIKDGGSPTSSANIIINQTQITSGTNKGLLFDSNGVVGNLGTLANGILVTDASGNPSISTTLPAGINLNLTIGVTGISSGTTKGLLFDNAGLLGNLATANNGILVTDGSGNPSISNTLPAGVTFSLTVGSTAIASGTTKGLLFDNAGVLGNLATADSGLLNTDSSGNASISTAPTLAGGPFTINPTAASLTQGITIASTGPSSGSQSSTANFNTMDVTNGRAVTGLTLDNFGSLPYSSALAVTYTDTASSNTIPIAIYGAARETTAGAGNVVGISGTGYSNISAAGDTIWGMIGFSHIGSAGSVLGSQAVDCESQVDSGGATTLRYGCVATSLGTGHGSTLDTAYAILSNNGTTGWKNAFTLISTSNSGFSPLTTDASIINSDGAITVANFANLSNVTFTGNIFSFQNFSLTGSGVGVLQGPSSSSAPIWTVTTSGGGANQVLASTNGTTGIDGYQAGTTSAASIVFMGVAEASNSAVQFGQTIGDWAKINTAGASNNGLIIGTSTAKPIIIGTNNTARMAISSTGLITSSANSANPAVAPTVGTLQYLLGADGANDNILTMDQYGGGGSNSSLLSFRKGDGTAASPTAVVLSDFLGGIRFRGYTGSAFYLTASISAIANETFSGTAGGADMVFFTTPNTTQAIAAAAYIKASGGLSVGSGGTDPGTGGLYVNGSTITFNGLATDSTHTDRTVCQDTISKSLFFGSGAAGICLGTSSERFKHDIQPLDVGLKQIELLKPVSYELNADHGDPNKILYGFTAEQGITVLPKLVGLDSTGHPQTFDYMGVVPVLVRAVQELKADNDDLRSQLVALKGRMAR